MSNETKFLYGLLIGGWALLLWGWWFFRKTKDE
jgi:hypothetical protein